MLRAYFWPVALLACGLTAVAQPVVTAVVDPAIFTITRFTPGEQVSLFGTGMGSSPSVAVDGKAPYIIYASDTQINMQLPVNIATGTRDVVVTNGTASQPFPLTIVTYSPVILYGNSTPTVTHADGTLVSSSKPALPGRIPQGIRSWTRPRDNAATDWFARTDESSLQHD